VKQGDLRALLEAYGLSPRQMFGQNFLVDPALLAAIPGDAGVQAGERVLEVGPGAGALTTELLRVGASVLAVEIDAGMYGLLQQQFAEEIEQGRLRLLHADVLASEERLHPEVEAWWSEGTPPRIVANLPYSISGPFLARLIGRPLLGACLLLQKEVAEKAANRTDAGPLPIRLGAHFRARMGRRVPAQVFWPRPRIDSAFLHLEPRVDAPSARVDAALRRILRAAFAQRRKQALRLLEREWPESAKVLHALGVAETARAEEVASETWLAAAEQLARHGDCV
jgi:16S rRNA (adenine1518-N6/adenine1519-N6)-dimethyltransferase